MIGWEQMKDWPYRLKRLRIHAYLRRHGMWADPYREWRDYGGEA